MYFVASLRKSVNYNFVFKANQFLTICMTSKQHARLFEAFANDCNPIGKSAVWNCKQRTRFFIGESVTVRFKRGLCVIGVNSPTRKYVHAFCKRSIQCALQHEYFYTIQRVIAQQHHCCRGPNWHHRWVKISCRHDCFAVLTTRLLRLNTYAPTTATTLPKTASGATVS